MNPLFIYRCITDGRIVVSTIDDATAYSQHDLFLHIGTIEPVAFLQTVLNDEPEIVEQYFK